MKIKTKYIPRTRVIFDYEQTNKMYVKSKTVLSWWLVEKYLSVNLLILRPARSTGRGESRRATETAVPTASLSVRPPRYIATAAASIARHPLRLRCSLSSLSALALSLHPHTRRGSDAGARSFPHGEHHLFLSFSSTSSLPTFAPFPFSLYTSLHTHNIHRYALLCLYIILLSIVYVIFNFLQNLFANNLNFHKLFA